MGRQFRRLEREGIEMIEFNGKKYAKNDAEFVGSLFDAGGTCNGFYKRVKNGIRLFDMKHNLAAFIVDRPSEKFIVTAHMQDGKPRYMFGTGSYTEKWLGIESLGMQATFDAINAIN